MKSLIGCLFACALSAALGISCSRHTKPESYTETDGITLDADVPGTQVFFAEKQLGTVPVTLSAKALASLGIPNPRFETNVVLLSDGLAETVFVAKGLEFKRFTFLVPEKLRADYVAMETPWGIRTKHAGCSFDPKKMIRVNCARLIDSEGLTLKLEALRTDSNGKDLWKLRVKLLNNGHRTIAGLRPAIRICRSAFCPPWRYRSDFALPSEWDSLGQGQSIETEILIDPPKTKGDYGIYAVFVLFKDATSDYLACSACYSNTKLLSVSE